MTLSCYLQFFGSMEVFFVQSTYIIIRKTQTKDDILLKSGKYFQDALIMKLVFLACFLGKKHTFGLIKKNFEDKISK